MNRDTVLITVEARPGGMDEKLFLHKDVAGLYGWPERTWLSPQEAEVAVVTNIMYMHDMVAERRKEKEK